MIKFATWSFPFSVQQKCVYSIMIAVLYYIIDKGFWYLKYILIFVINNSFNYHISISQFEKYEIFYQIMHKVDYDNRDEGRKEGKSGE